MGDRGYDQKIFQDKKLVDEFVCLFCLGVLKNPVITPKGCEFCESCILECITSHNNVPFNCPACQNENIEQIKLNESRRTRQTIDSLKTHCLNFSDKTNPCHWKGPRSAFETHMNICPVELVPCNCRTDGCKGKVFRRDLESHQKIASLTSKKHISSTPDIHGFKIVQLPKSRSGESSPNGVYCGEWKDGKKHGLGLLKYSDNDWYQGEWQNDKMHGFGVLQSNIDKHAGWFENGKKHGQGTVTYSNGWVVSNMWVDGECNTNDVQLSSATTGNKSVVKKSSAASNKLSLKDIHNTAAMYDDSWSDDFGFCNSGVGLGKTKSASAGSSMGAIATTIRNSTVNSINNKSNAANTGTIFNSSSSGSTQSIVKSRPSLYGNAKRTTPLFPSPKDVVDLDNSDDDINNLWSRLNAKSTNSTNSNSSSKEKNNTSGNVTNVNHSSSSNSSSCNNINAFSNNTAAEVAANGDSDFYSNRVSAALNAKNIKSAAAAKTTVNPQIGRFELATEASRFKGNISTLLSPNAAMKIPMVPGQTVDSNSKSSVKFFNKNNSISKNVATGPDEPNSRIEGSGLLSKLNEKAREIECSSEVNGNKNNTSSSNSGSSSNISSSSRMLAEPTVLKRKRDQENSEYENLWEMMTNTKKPSAAAAASEIDKSNSNSKNNNNSSGSIVGNSTGSSAFAEPTPRKFKSRISSEENPEYVPFGLQSSKTSKGVNSSSSIGGNNSVNSPLSNLIQSNLLALQKNSSNNNSNFIKTSASNNNTNNNISTSVSATTTSNIVYSTNNTNNTNTNNSRVNNTAWNTNNAPFPSHTANVLRSLHTSDVANSVSSSSGSTQQRSTRSQVKKNDL